MKECVLWSLVWLTKILAHENLATSLSRISNQTAVSAHLIRLYLQTQAMLESDQIFLDILHDCNFYARGGNFFPTERIIMMNWSNSGILHHCLLGKYRSTFSSQGTSFHICSSLVVWWKTSSSLCEGRLFHRKHLP